MKAPVEVGGLVAGRYRVERVIGEGGMGVVVAARHVKLDERVAIKFLLKEALLRPDLIARFLREGRSAAQIRSEHVARVVDADELETGEPFLVMEYLEGRDLGAVLKAEGRLPIETAVRYVLQVCEALAAMHALGIVHRDMKPSNLFLTRHSDGSPVIKVIDFGISKHTSDDAEPGGDGLVTETAAILGSPKYMAPEQMRSTRDVDARADLWAIGAILHALLTGEPPFSGLSMMEVYDRILDGAPPLRTLLPAAPAGLEAVLLRCLERDRAKRYADVAELAAALVEFGPAEGVASARRAWGILRAQPLEASSHVASKDPSTKTTRAEVAATSQINTETPVVSAAAAPSARRWAPALAVAAAVVLVAGGVLLWPRERPRVDPGAPAAATAVTVTPLATAAAPADSAAPPPAATPRVEPSSSAPEPLSTARPRPVAVVSPRATATASTAPPLASSAPAPPPVPAATQPTARHGIY
jgi:serine/threonine-protein kinase